MTDAARTTPDPRAEAIRWFVHRRSGAAPEALRAWLAADPANAAAYAEVERLWAASSEVAEHPAVESWVGGLVQGVERRRFSRRAIAAGLAAVVIGLGAAGIYSLTAQKPLANQAFRTAIGQQATVTLPDGSSVTLNTGTIVRTRTDGERRLVYLDQGQAFFKVAHDRRHPFVVTAAGRTVTALGTAFDVRIDKGALKVVLVEGKVRVESVEPSRVTSAPPDAVATEMRSGTQLVAPTDADWRVTKADIPRETSWLSGQIVISNETLPEAIEELNRYSQRKIVLGDQSLAATRVSGVFRPGDLEGFVRALKTSGLAHAGQETDSEVRVVAMK